MMMRTLPAIVALAASARAGDTIKTGHLVGGDLALVDGAGAGAYSEPSEPATAAEPLAAPARAATKKVREAPDVDPKVARARRAILAGREKRQKMAELFGAPQRPRIRGDAGTPHGKMMVRTSIDEEENRLADAARYDTPKNLAASRDDATTDGSDAGDDPVRPTTPHFVS